MFSAVANSYAGLPAQYQLPASNQPLVPCEDFDPTNFDFSTPSVQEYLSSGYLDCLANEALAFHNVGNDSTLNAGYTTQSTQDPISATEFAHIESDLLLNAAGYIPSIDNNPTLPETQTFAAVESSLLPPTRTLANDQFATVQEETTLSLGIMEQLDNLEKQIVEMRRFVASGFAKRDNLRSWDIESSRLMARNINYDQVTEISEAFRMLLRSDGQVPERCPLNGVELKNLTRMKPSIMRLSISTENTLTNVSHVVFLDSEIDALLDEYDLPFDPSMFLHEKQLIYLRFIGANRALMHRVVD